MDVYYLNNKRYLSLRDLYDDYEKTNTPGTTYKNFVKRYRKGMSLEDAISIPATRNIKNTESRSSNKERDESNIGKFQLRRLFEITHLKVCIEEVSKDETVIRLFHPSISMPLASTILLLSISKNNAENLVGDIKNIINEQGFENIEEVAEPLSYSIKLDARDYNIVSDGVIRVLKEYI